VKENNVFCWFGRRDSKKMGERVTKKSALIIFGERETKTWKLKGGNVGAICQSGEIRFWKIYFGAFFINKFDMLETKTRGW